MDVYVVDDEIGRYFRRWQLACRMLSHGARAKTTSQWSGLTPDQLVTMRRRWRFDSEHTVRGRSPTSFRDFFGSTQRAYEATIAVLLGRLCHVVPPVKRDAAIQSLENGERLCLAYELYRGVMPDSKLCYESFVLLIAGVARGREIELSKCRGCEMPLLIDRLGEQKALCGVCERGWAKGARGRKRKVASGRRTATRAPRPLLQPID